MRILEYTVTGTWPDSGNLCDGGTHTDLEVAETTATQLERRGAFVSIFSWDEAGESVEIGW